MVKRAAKMGRPAFPKGKAKSVQFAVRVEPSLHEKLKAAAGRDGKGVATWVRDTVARLLGSE